MTQRLDVVREANRSQGSLPRHPSFRRAVCIDALVRICAGGRFVRIVPTATGILPSP